MGVFKPKGRSEFPLIANGPNGERKLFDSGPLPAGWSVGIAPPGKELASGGAPAAKFVVPKGASPALVKASKVSVKVAPVAPAKAPLKAVPVSPALKDPSAAVKAAVASQPKQTQITRAQLEEALNEAGIPFKPTDSTAELVKKLEAAAGA